MPPRAAFLLPLLLLCGCLQPLEFSPVRLSGPSGSRVDLDDSLGVVPLADLRPREQKRGKSPWLVPLIVWNQRTGRYVTSSDHLGGDVSGDVSEAVAEALSGWRFGRGRVLLVEPGSPLADQCAGDLSYVAGGEIHHLYGAVRQRSWVLFLPVPWFPAWATGNQVGDPVGVARLSLRVHDCRGGAEIVSRRFVSEGLFPRLSASAAAQRAFDELMREMAGLSRADPSQPSQAAPPGDDPDVAPPDPVAPEPPPATEREDPPEPEEEREPGGLVPL